MSLLLQYFTNILICCWIVFIHFNQGKSSSFHSNTQINNNNNNVINEQSVTLDPTNSDRNGAQIITNNAHDITSIFNVWNIKVSNNGWYLHITTNNAWKFPPKSVSRLTLKIYAQLSTSHDTGSLLVSFNQTESSLSKSIALPTSNVASFYNENNDKFEIMEGAHHIKKQFHHTQNQPKQNIFIPYTIDIINNPIENWSELSYTNPRAPILKHSQRFESWSSEYTINVYIGGGENVGDIINIQQIQLSLSSKPLQQPPSPSLSINTANTPKRKLLAPTREVIWGQVMTGAVDMTDWVTRADNAVILVDDDLDSRGSNNADETQWCPVNGENCWELCGQEDNYANAYIYRLASTKGYKDIEFQYSIDPYSMNDGDYCQISYTVDNGDTNWIEIDRYSTPEFVRDLIFEFDSTADDKDGVGVKVWANSRGYLYGDSTGGYDCCRFRDFYLTGIPITDDPTAYPTTTPTTDPTTDPSKIPTNTPSIHPTYTPSITPTSLPTTHEPSTAQPSTNQPSSNPTVHPSSYPTTQSPISTQTPTGQPTIQSTNVPTSTQPSAAPTRQPIVSAPTAPKYIFIDPDPSTTCYVSPLYLHDLFFHVLTTDSVVG